MAIAKPELYVAVFHHEYGVDCFAFYFLPQGRHRYPSPRKVAEHFQINFEPSKGESFELIAVVRPDLETLPGRRFGRQTPAPADWWEEGQEGWLEEDDRETE